MAAAIFRPRANASMPPMWAWNRSIGSKLSRRTLASKFTPPGAKPPCFRMHQHALRRQVDVGRELVGVPAEQQVAAVGVDRAEHALHAHAYFQFVHHRVAGQRGVVGLDVQLEVLVQAVAAQEVRGTLAASKSY